MFKKKSLKLYRKAAMLENIYGSKMTDKMVIGRVGYKIFTLPAIFVYSKWYKKSKPDRILMDSKPDFSGNVKALYDYMTDNHMNKSYKITWIVDEPKLYGEFKAKNVKFIPRHSKYAGFYTAKFYKTLWKSRFSFSTEMLNWYDFKSKNQLYINMQDNAGLQLRFRDEEEIEMKNDYYIVPSEHFIPSVKELYRCKKKQVLPLGQARCYQFYRNRREAENYFGQLTKKSAGAKNILWVPFMRDGEALVRYKTGIASMTGLSLVHNTKDFLHLNSLCASAGIRLFIYFNPRCGMLRKEAGDLSHISFITDEECRKNHVDIYELMGKFDAILCDYGPAAIDCLLLDKPVGYVLEDYEDFLEADGFIVKDIMEYMPGDKIYTTGDLQAFFTRILQGEDAYRQQRIKVRDEIHNLSQDNCKRILEHFGIR